MTDSVLKNIKNVRQAIRSSGCDFVSPDLHKISPSHRIFTGGRVNDGSHFYIEVAADSIFTSGFTIEEG